MSDFRMRPDRPAPADAPPATAGLDYEGRPADPASPRCVAKAARHPETASVAHFVRVGTSGYAAAGLFDPREHEPAQLWQDNPATGRPRWEWRRVDAAAHAAYAAFLTTGDPAHLAAARRALA